MRLNCLKYGIMKTKKCIRFIALLFTILELILTGGCNKEKPLMLPQLSTAPLTDVTSTSVICGGNVTSDGGSSIIGRGICWSTQVDPTLADNFTTDGTGAGKFISSVNGLSCGTNYYMRAYATNVEGTSYGNEFIFILPLTDVDGNVYNTVMIGNQAWMTTNLKTSRYYDKTNIPLVTDNTQWSARSSSAFCWYKNDVGMNIDNYGALYNWFAVNTGKLCPIGWHVPSEYEWAILTDCIGGEYTASGKLKEAGEDHWFDPNYGASNDYGFTALPGGYRTGLAAGSFRARGFSGWWWASSEDQPTTARGRQMTFDSDYLARGSALKQNGYSVRCIKD